MIFFIGAGRVGNQLFQYAFLKTISKNNEKIISFNLDELLDIFEVEKIYNFKFGKKWKKRLLRYIIYPTLKVLAYLKIITSIEVNYDHPPGYADFFPKRESDTYTCYYGLINSIKLVKTGFFQSEKFFNYYAIRNLNFKKTYIKSVENFISVIPSDFVKIFVHIRKGDYNNFLILGKPTVLPIEYYKFCIDYFRSKYPNCFFIFLSDDPKEVKNDFDYLENKIFSINNPVGFDLALMSKCKGAILSPSSFSWWGAYFMKSKIEILAPQYWLGFNSKIEFPQSGFPSFAKPVEILSNESFMID